MPPPFPLNRFTLVFLCAPEDLPINNDYKDSPLIEVTYNWPDTNGNKEFLSQGPDHCNQI